MAYRRRRKFVRRGPRGAGRQKIWVQSTAGTIPVGDTASGIFQGELITPADWERVDNAQTQPSIDAKGGARLEGMYLHMAMQLKADSQNFEPVIPEVMVWSQSNRFLPLVNSSAGFDTTMDQQRVLLYSFGDPVKSINGFTGSTTGLGSQTERMFFQVKSKAKLNDRSICVAVRTSIDTTLLAEATVVVAFRALITVP